MNRQAFYAAAAVLGLSMSAEASQLPVPGPHDVRVRYVDYDPSNVVEVSTAPGAILVLEFSEDETFDSVGVSDRKTIESDERGHFVFLKLNGCLIPQPVLVTMRRPNGKLRLYNLSVFTSPGIRCDEQPAPAQPDIRTVGLISSANASPAPPPERGTGNLRFANYKSLAAGADVSYHVAYRYPGDAAERRREERQARLSKSDKAAASELLKRETDFAASDPFYGNRNYAYVGRGSDLIKPRMGWDNGFLTSFLIPGLQHVPAVFAGDCKIEGGLTPTTRGDTISFLATSAKWCLRDGPNVYEIWNLAYRPDSPTPGTGTASREVERVVKGTR